MSYPWQFAHSIPLYPYTLDASSSLAWPLVPFTAQPESMLIVYQCVYLNDANILQKRGFKRNDE